MNEELRRIQICSWVSHWNATLVHLMGQYCSNALLADCSASQRTGPTARLLQNQHWIRVDRSTLGKDTQAVVHVLQGLLICTKTSLDQLVDEVHLQTVDQGSTVCGTDDREINHLRDQRNGKTLEMLLIMVTLPPVSLSSTKISSFSSLQGISGSSPITVKVASNSPSTRNLTRPLAS